MLQNKQTNDGQTAAEKLKKTNSKLIMLLILPNRLRRNEWRFFGFPMWVVSYTH